MSIKIVTTFAENAWPYAERAVDSFIKHWPENLKLDVYTDSLSCQEKYSNNKRIVLHDIPQTALDFFANYKGTDQADRLSVFNVKRAHKIFAAHHAAKDDVNHLIFLESDVITTKDLLESGVSTWLPDENQVATFLSRSRYNDIDGAFMAFNLKKDGLRFLEDLYNYYKLETYLTQPRFDEQFAVQFVRNNWMSMGYEFKDLTHGVTYRDVFPQSPLSEYMIHLRGPVAKLKGIPTPEDHIRDTDEGLECGKVMTKNCVDHDLICNNVKKNTHAIKNWLQNCRPQPERPCIIANAGPSLPLPVIKRHALAGDFIIAMKHSVNRLVDNGIIPDAVVLLDPRDHVKDFVREAHKEITWIVSSMVDPSVVDSLIEQEAKILGWHAPVNAGEDKFFAPQQLLVHGGSAASIRAIEIAKILGFSQFKLYGYDLCTYTKPDLKGDGECDTIGWMELTLSAHDGVTQLNRMFWTKAEFIAQLQEFEKWYLNDPKIEVFGEGLLPWVFRCSRSRRIQQEMDISHRPTIESLINAS